MGVETMSKTVLYTINSLLQQRRYQAALAVLKGFRNGAVYGAKIRAPHALVMTFLFRSGSLREKLKAIFQATYTHSRNLAYFVFTYKGLMALQSRIQRKKIPVHSFLVACVGGWLVFGENNNINSQVEEYGGQFSDDTSLNGIRLYCSRSRVNGSVNMYTVESESGIFGKWSNVTWCPDDTVLNAFELKVQPRQGSPDETAVNNIKFRCSKGAILEIDGGRFGDYDMWSPDCYKGGICGIQTRQQRYAGVFVDDTSLNDVHFYCCE